MKKITTSPAGVVKQQISSDPYSLARYYPCEKSKTWVDIFWCVEWCLPKAQIFTQTNLPDPYFHLVFDSGNVSLVAPVLNQYSYTMQGRGHIFGVKFNVGLIPSLLGLRAKDLVDKTYDVQALRRWEVFAGIDEINQQISAVNGHHEKQTTLFKEWFCYFFPERSNTDIQRAQTLLEIVKSEKHINSVSVLSEYSGIGVRTIQRLFDDYVGVQPKWFIRKQRMHNALADIEKSNGSMTAMALDLGFSDQAHFSREFKYFIGVTPCEYRIKFRVNRP
ncbi:helix-turn-helix domain-containing protein [Agaribacter flavus]|uniref:Helix-turn-helix domain-containing protein n=1 Tax=Agaribacter flavus TaxID=1902781 RepID=A0ABV7FQW1_9ALTE